MYGFCYSIFNFTFWTLFFNRLKTSFQIAVKIFIDSDAAPNTKMTINVLNQSNANCGRKNYVLYYCDAAERRWDFKWHQTMLFLKKTYRWILGLILWFYNPLTLRENFKLFWEMLNTSLEDMNSNMVVEGNPVQFVFCADTNALWLVRELAFRTDAVVYRDL